MGLVILSFCGILSCSDEEKLVYISDSDVVNVEVSGTVYAYYCGWFEGYNGSTRYTVATGEKATIKFLRLGDYSYIFETDDSSDYKMLIDTGTYDIIVEIGHSFPDTAENVYIANDTTIDFEFIYATLIPDTLSLEFYYNPAADSLGEEVETNHLNSLNGRLGNVLDIENCTRTAHYSQILGSYHVYYYTAFDTSYYFWQVVEAANNILAIYESVYPEELDVHFFAIYCLFNMGG